MDPATAVGLVLGILPLIASVIKHYDFFQPFLMPCAFVRELKDFQYKLNMRRRLFINECRLLLEDVIQDPRENLIDDMLSLGPVHESWTDSSLDAQIEEYLGESYEIYLETMQAIQDRIGIIKEKTKGLCAVIAPTEERKKTFSSEWRQRIREHVNLAFKKNGLYSQLDGLRDLNEELRVLGCQIKELKKGQQRRAQITATQSRKAQKMDLVGFQMIRETSENLYQALSKVSSCLVPGHTQHSAALCIEAKPVQTSKIPRVKFAMAFEADIDGTVWVNIESNNNSFSASGTISVVQQDVTHGPLVVSALKRTLEESEVESGISTKAGKAKVKVNANVKREPSKHTISQSWNLGVQQARVDWFANSSSYGGLQDMCVPDLSTRDFCFHLRQNIHNSDNKETCAGFIREGTCNHLVYVRRNLIQAKAKARSLTAILMDIPKSWTLSSRYFPSERIRLARLLAKAVLEYHDTPWLLDSWRSRDVQFFASDSESTSQLSQPHLMVRFPGNRRTLKEPTCQSLAENNILFGLATIFLELDFEKPLSHMCLPEDIVKSSPQDTEYKTARRLARSTHPGLGPDFRKIIRKCLQCNFGLDETDLKKSEELKSAIHEEVIHRLEDLERKLESCTLDGVTG